MISSLLSRRALCFNRAASTARTRQSPHPASPLTTSPSGGSERGLLSSPKMPGEVRRKRGERGFRMSGLLGMFWKPAVQIQSCLLVLESRMDMSKQPSIVRTPQSEGLLSMRKFPFFLTVLLIASGFLFALSTPARADDDDPPGRVARLNYIQGSISFQPGGSTDWVQANPNRPLTAGDNLWTDRNSRGELHIGSTSLRLSSET